MTWEGLFTIDANIFQAAWRIKHSGCRKQSECHLKLVLKGALVCKGWECQESSASQGTAMVGEGR